MNQRLDSMLHSVGPKRALIADGRGKLVGIVPWNKRRGGRMQPFTKEFNRDDDPGPVGRWIRACRTERGMSQGQLAKAIDIMRGETISRWETGQGLPGGESQRRLELLFGEMGDD